MEKRSSLTRKIATYFFLIGFVFTSLTSAMFYYIGRNAIKDRTFDQLTSVREVKKDQLHFFFNERYRDIKLLRGSNEFLSYIHNTDSILDQDYFIKYLKGSNSYSSILLKYNSDSIVCINLYNNTRELISQPSTPLQKIFDISSTIKDVSIGDLNYYLNDTTPELILSTAIKSSKSSKSNINNISILIPAKAINNIMLESNAQKGLGQSGESYLVGSDLLMRSQSRFNEKSVLKTMVKTESVEAALEGQTGTKTIKDYRNTDVLSSFTTLNIGNLKWVVLAEIDIKESFRPIMNFRNQIIILVLILGFIIFILTETIASQITKPLLKLIDVANNIRQGNLEAHIDFESNDEVGELSSSIGKMAKQLKNKANQVQEREEKLQIERQKRTSALFDGQEMERQRLSRELHDGLGQTLVATKLKLESIDYQDKNYTQSTIESLKAQIHGIIDDVRRMSYDLIPSVLHEFGLKTALENLCREATERSKISFEFELPEFKLSDDKLRTYVYRICQESINNTIKHSNAKNALLKITEEDNQIIMLIKDNGEGFNMDNPEFQQGNGIYNMRERVNLLHGSFEINSEQNKGTEINFTIPLEWKK